MLYSMQKRTHELHALEHHCGVPLPLATGKRNATRMKVIKSSRKTSTKRTITAKNRGKDMIVIRMVASVFTCRDGFHSVLALEDANEFYAFFKFDLPAA